METKIDNDRILNAEAEIRKRQQSPPSIRRRLEELFVLGNVNKDVRRLRERTENCCINV
jgi:hypothetical protein